MKYLLFILFFLFQIPVSAQNSPQKFADSVAADIEKKYPEHLFFNNYQDYNKFMEYVEILSVMTRNIKNNDDKLHQYRLLKEKFAEKPFWLAYIHLFEARVYFETKDPLFKEASEKTLFYWEKDKVYNRKYLILALFVGELFAQRPESELVAYLEKLEKNDDNCKYKKIGILSAQTAYFYVHKDFKKAILSLLDQQKEAEKIKDKLLLTYILRQLGILFYDMGRYEKYIDYSRKLMALLSNSKIDLAIIHNNIGAAYKKMGNYDAALLHLDSCIFYAKQYPKKDVSGVWQGIALENKGQILMVEKKYGQAIEQFKKAVPLCENYGEYGTQATALIYIGKCLSENSKNLPQAQIYFDSAVVVTQKLGNSFSKTPQLLKYHLADYYAKIGKYKDAYENHLRYTQMQDSLDKNLNRKESEELQVQYETEKKEQEILLQKQTIQFQERQNWFFSFTALMTVFSAIYLFYNNRQKQKINKVLESKNHEIESQKAELENLNTTKDRLFAIISHDLKSPINSLKNFMEILEMDIPKEERILLQNDIFRLLDNSFQTLDNLLNWAKNQMEGIKYSPQNLHIGELSQQIILFLKPTANTKNILIDNQIQKNHQIWADNDHLQLILRNLISNAIKFTPENGKIFLKSLDLGEQIQISIQDTGVGMREEDIKKVFEGKANFTTKGTSGEKGTGLGLMLCKEFMEKNKAILHLKSEPHQGTEFLLVFPKKQI